MESPDWRFAYWLAARLGHFDVEEMLASAPAGTLHKWREYVAVEPFGDDWQQTSLVATQIINAIQSVAVGMSGKRINRKDLLDWDAFVPTPQKKTKRKNSLSESAAILRGMCGM